MNQKFNDQIIDQLKAEAQQNKQIINNLLQENQALRNYIRDLENPDNANKYQTIIEKTSSKDSTLVNSSKYLFLIIGVTVTSSVISIGLIINALNRKAIQEPTNPSLKPETNQGKKPNLPSNQIANNIYQYAPYPNLKFNQNLQSVVNNIVSYAKSKQFPVDKLSVTLIDVNTGEMAGYQQENLVYPASVVKLFWLAALCGQFSQGIEPYTDKTALQIDIKKMIKNSDNEAASRIIDRLTTTTSGVELTGEEYKQWTDKRYLLNDFFEKAGYKGLNISQKTFPIPSEKLDKPKGRDLQIRGNPESPIRNKISTQQAARLMYEIFTNKAISPEYSQYMQQWLLWDLNSTEWRNMDPNIGQFNPIRTFFSELLPTDLIFASKAGWTSNTRQEVAFISTRDGKVSYILSIFAEDSSYAQSAKIFPEISLKTFKVMSHKN
jgi:beta-lactamase class A